VGSDPVVELELGVARDAEGRLSGWLRRGATAPRMFSGTLDLLAGIDELVPDPTLRPPGSHEASDG
jgi:hypothetical protein